LTHEMYLELNSPDFPDPATHRLIMASMNRDFL
jgi:hypothetical protein